MPLGDPTRGAGEELVKGLEDIPGALTMFLGLGAIIGLGGTCGGIVDRCGGLEYSPFLRPLIDTISA